MKLKKFNKRNNQLNKDKKKLNEYNSKKEEIIKIVMHEKNNEKSSRKKWKILNKK